MADTQFERERQQYRNGIASNEAVREAGRQFLLSANPQRYSYNFDWLGLPIIQYPADIVAVQELIWRIRPEVVIETGVARGGSLALSASLLELLGGDRFVIGVELELRDHNRRALKSHSLAHRFRLIEGSSTDPSIVEQVAILVGSRGPVLVLLDSSHTHDHVSAELEAYSPFVSAGSYVVVFDTVIEYLRHEDFPDRPWHPGNSPKTAVDKFLAQPGCRFEVDKEFDSKLIISVAPGGYLRCIR